MINVMYGCFPWRIVVSQMRKKNEKRMEQTRDLELKWFENVQIKIFSKNKK